ncbi:MAG: hypothetical protein FWC21_04795 [Treponema sp.]|nr:hypothetical protein [Treponema sp.]
MKKTQKKKETMHSIVIIAILTIIVSILTACGSFASSGTTTTASTSARQAAEPGLIITGLEKWNGLRVQADSDNGDVESFFAAARVINGDEYDPMAGAKGVGVIIENGTATLNVWDLKIGEMDWDIGSVDITAVPYTGNDTIEFTVEIWDGGETLHWHSFVARGTVTAAFSGGAARVAFVLEYEREADMWD